MKYIAIVVAAIALAGCSDAAKQKISGRLDTVVQLAAKVKETLPAVCKKLDDTKLDEMIIAAVSLALSELAGPTAGVVAGNVLAASENKVCEWNGVKLTQQAEL